MGGIALTLHIDKQNELENATPADAGNAPQTESKPKKQRGGKRPGAGRKKDPVKIVLKGVHRDTINAAVEGIDVGSTIRGLLKQHFRRPRSRPNPRSATSVPVQRGIDRASNRLR